MARTAYSFSIRHPRVGDFKVSRRADEVILNLGSPLVRLVCATRGGLVEDIPALEAEADALEELIGAAAEAAGILRERVAELKTVRRRRAS